MYTLQLVYFVVTISDHNPSRSRLRYEKKPLAPRVNIGGSQFLIADDFIQRIRKYKWSLFPTQFLELYLRENVCKTVKNFVLFRIRDVDY